MIFVSPLSRASLRFFLGWFSIASVALAAEPDRIVILRPEEPHHAAADELRVRLHDATGQALSISEGVEDGKPGIFIGTADDAPTRPELRELAQRLRKEKSREAFALFPDAERGQLFILTRTPDGLIPAVSEYLYRLGFRWFFPGPRWTIVPHPETLLLPGPIAQSPAFRLRSFFGTGGFGPKLPADPEGVVPKAWGEWLKWNRLIGEEMRGGHANEGIIRQNRKLFEEHPEFRAFVNGDRVPMSSQFQFCYGNPELQKCYVENRVETLAKMLEANPNVQGITVEPADGSGHCECPECTAIGSVSDRVFMLANLTARAVAQRFPGKYVNLLAYNQHASVPSIPLEPNIFVRLVPYAFQNSGLRSEELIKVWGEKKQGDLGIYDYWAITDWAHCQPSLDYSRSLPAKIRFWNANHLDGLGIESSYSAGAIGLPVYIASRLLWNPAADEKALADEFFEKCFGPAQAPMRRMLDRWSNEYFLTPNELALCYLDLQEALALASNAEVLARVRDYVTYVHYLRLMLESRQAGTDEQLSKALAWIEFTWRMHSNLMVQSYRMERLVAFRLYPTLKEQILAHWPIKSGEGPGWESYRPLEENEIDALVADGAKVYRPLYEPAFYSLRNLRALTDGGAGQNDAKAETGPMLGSGLFALQRVFPKTTVEISADAPTRLELFRSDEDRAPIATQSIEAKQWVQIVLPAENGIYRLKVNATRKPYRIRASVDACLTALRAVEVRQPKQTTYFYVPPGQKTIALYAPTAIARPMQVFDANGTQVDVNDGVLKVIPVPEGQAGRIWSARNYAGNRATPLVFVNGPRVYGFSPAGMLIPDVSRPSAAPIPEKADAEAEEENPPEGLGN